MKTIEEFKKDNEKVLLDLKTAAVNGGGGPRHIETNTTNFAEYGGSDTETWVYEGGMPISGTIKDKDGNDHVVL